MFLKVSTGVLYDGGVGGWSRDLKVIKELLKVIKQDVDFMSKSFVNMLCREVFQHYTVINSSAKATPNTETVGMFWNSVE